MTRYLPFFLVIITISAVLHPSIAHAEQPTQQASIQGYDMVRNGQFILGTTAWLVAGTYSGPYPEAARDQNGAGLNLVTTDQSASMSYALQQLYPISNTTKATFKLSFRLVPKANATLGGFQVALASTQRNQIQPIMVLKEINSGNFPGSAWQDLSIELNATQLSQINQVRAAGQPLYLYIALQGMWMSAHVDNASFMTAGTMVFPMAGGTLAFTINDTTQTPGKFQIWSCAPTGQNAQMLFEAEGTCYGLDWSPAGDALAFASSHEKAWSRFSADIFELKGGTLRKVTNPPGREEAKRRSRGRGTVTGNIINQTKRNLVAAVYVEGADKLEFVSLLPYPTTGHKQKYTVQNVSDYGAGQQYVCAREGDYVWNAALGADVVAGQTVAGGDIYITDSRSTYIAGHPSYSSDGRAIYYTIPMIQKVPVSGGVGSNPDGWASSISVLALEASPVDGSLLFQSAYGNSISMISGGTSAVDLVKTNSGVGPESPSWTHDGAGFVFCMPGQSNTSGGKDIHYYHFANRQYVPLTQLYNEWAEHPAVSPDGRFIAFERVYHVSNNQGGYTWRELWIMQADNPNVMWPLVRQGDPRYPRWKK